MSRTRQMTRLLSDALDVGQLDGRTDGHAIRKTFLIFTQNDYCLSQAA